MISISAQLWQLDNKTASDIRFRFFRKNFSSPIPIIFSPLKSRTRKCTWNGSYICNTRFRFRCRQWAERLTRRISTFSRLTRLRAFDSNAFGIRSRRNTEKRIRWYFPWNTGEKWLPDSISMGIGISISPLDRVNDSIRDSFLSFAFPPPTTLHWSFTDL